MADALRGWRAVVTGGAGFIASNVADRLLAEGARVVAFDNLDPYYDPAQKRRNIARARANPEYAFVEADVCDRAALDRVFLDLRPTVAVHCAARAGVTPSIADPFPYTRVNEMGGLEVLDACRRAGGVPIAYASTSSVYGVGAVPPFSEREAADTPASPYAASKRAGELMAHSFHHVHGLPVAVLRFFTVYGPRGRPDMAFAKFTRALRLGEVIKLRGESTERDFTYVDDIVDGVIASLHWLHRTRSFGTFNLGRSEPVRVRRLIELLQAALDREARIEVTELEKGEMLATAADVSRAREAFGYAPRVPLEEGVRLWVRWLDSDEAPALTDAP